MGDPLMTDELKLGTEGPASSLDKYDVVVVGAGFAGLGAARTLAAFGLRAVVVEARDRIGGRAHTTEFPAAPEFGLEAVPVEEGCNYLHGCGDWHVLFALARRLALPSACCPADLGGRHGGWESQEVAEWHDAGRGGEQISMEEVMDAFLLLNHALQGVACTAELPDDSDEAGGADACRAEKQPPTARDLNSAFEEALASVLKLRTEAGRRAEPVLSARERGLVYSMRGRLFGYVSPASRMPSWIAAAEMGGRERCEKAFQDPHWPHSNQSLVEELKGTIRHKLELVRELGSQGPEVDVAAFADGEDRLLLGQGFRSLIDFLAEGLDVVTGERVVAVDQRGGDGVSVRLSSGRVLEALHAIVTAPVGVLAGLDSRSTIEFLPPLPASKQTAFRHLAIPYFGASTHEKVVLRWERSAPFVANVLDVPGAALQLATTDRRFHFLNLHKYGREGQLLCHIWADAEWREHGELSDEGVVAEVVEALRAAFPGPVRAREAGEAGEAGEDGRGPLVTEPRQAKVTRWAQDPFALGAYSELQDPGASERDRREYARTEGHVLFAGEGAVPSSAGAQCTHGALLSGVSAAVEVLARHSDGRTRPRRAFPAARLLCEEGPVGLSVPEVVELLAEPLAPGRGRAAAKRKRRPGGEGGEGGGGGAPGAGAA